MFSTCMIASPNQCLTLTSVIITWSFGTDCLYGPGAGAKTKHINSYCIVLHIILYFEGMQLNSLLTCVHRETDRPNFKMNA